MRWVILLLAGLFAALGASSATLADGKGAAIKVTVLGADGKPMGGVPVQVTTWPPDGNGPATGGTTDKDGNFTAATDSKGAPLAPETYEIRVSGGIGEAKQIVYVGEGGKAEIVVDSNRFAGVSDDVDSAFIIASAAKDNGDSESYGKTVEFIRRGIAQDERLADEAQAAAEAFARDNGLRVTNLAGAQKDLKKLNQLGDRGDQEVKRNLEQYIKKLQEVDRMRRDLDTDKKRLAELEARKFGSKQSSVVPLPSACPEGQKGGLLAGVINSATGSDLAGICDDKERQPRDRDKKDDRHDRHERD
jgi:hypothetical protein